MTSLKILSGQPIALKTMQKNKDGNNNPQEKTFAYVQSMRLTAYAHLHKTKHINKSTSPYTINLTQLAGKHNGERL